jgi:hypothetical protein
MNAERLQPDPRVAFAAWRFPSETRPRLFHDVALMVPDERARGPWWDCSCEAFAFDDHVPCKHIQAARRLWAEERRRGR